jgi:hypothetical protein
VTVMDDLQDYSDRLAQKIEELQDGLNEVGELSGEKKREVNNLFLYFYNKPLINYSNFYRYSILKININRILALFYVLILTRVI